MNTSTVALASLIATATTTGAWAQGNLCAQLRLSGMFDTIQEVSQHTMHQYANQTYCSRQHESQTQARNHAIQLGLPLSIFSLTFGSNSAQSNFRAWETSFCSAFGTDSSEQGQLISIRREMSVSMMEVFRECVGQPLSVLFDINDWTAPLG